MACSGPIVVQHNWRTYQTDKQENRCVIDLFERHDTDLNKRLDHELRVIDGLHHQRHGGILDVL